MADRDKPQSSALPSAQGTTDSGEPVTVNVTMTTPTNQPAPATPGLDEAHPGGRFLVQDGVDSKGNPTYREVNAGGQSVEDDPAKNMASAARASGLPA